MSIITLFTRVQPTLAGTQFDAVLEDTFELDVEYTTYPIESGAVASDHGVIKPMRWRLTGAVSNNPLRPTLTDFTGGLSNFFDDSGLFASVAGLSAGLLAGSSDTRGSSMLAFLIGLTTSRIPFDIDAGDIQLENMVINNLKRTKDPENEGGLIFDAQLQELPTLDRVLSDDKPNQKQLRAGDPAKSQIASVIDKGEQVLKDTGDNIRTTVNNILGF